MIAPSEAQLALQGRGGGNRGLRPARSYTQLTPLGYRVYKSCEALLTKSYRITAEVPLQELSTVKKPRLIPDPVPPSRHRDEAVPGPSHASPGSSAASSAELLAAVVWQTDETQRAHNDAGKAPCTCLVARESLLGQETGEIQICIRTYIYIYYVYKTVIIYTCVHMYMHIQIYIYICRFANAHISVFVAINCCL